jgi:hypothetical protein
MDIRCINNLCYLLEEINNLNPNIKENKYVSYRPINEMYSYSLTLLNTALSDLMISLKGNDTKILKNNFKYFMRILFQFLNDDLNSIIKITLKDDAVKVNKYLKSIREYKIDYLENKIKHNQNDFILVDYKLSNNHKVKSFFLTETLQPLTSTEKYRLAPDRKIHSYYKKNGVEYATAFSLNYYIGDCLRILIESIFYVLKKLNEKYNLDIEKNKDLKILGTITSVSLEKFYLPNEKAFKKYQIIGYTHCLINEKSLTYFTISEFSLTLKEELSLGVSYVIPYLEK